MKENLISTWVSNPCRVSLKCVQSPPSQYCYPSPPSSSSSSSSPLRPKWLFLLFPRMSTSQSVEWNGLPDATAQSDRCRTLKCTSDFVITVGGTFVLTQIQLSKSQASFHYLIWQSLATLPCLAASNHVTPLTNFQEEICLLCGRRASLIAVHGLLLQLTAISTFTKNATIRDS
jgi:hypothetical protein